MPSKPAFTTFPKFDAVFEILTSEKTFGDVHWGDWYSKFRQNLIQIGISRKYHLQGVSRQPPSVRRVHFDSSSQFPLPVSISFLYPWKQRQLCTSSRLFKGNFHKISTFSLQLCTVNCALQFILSPRSFFTFRNPQNHSKPTLTPSATGRRPTWPTALKFSLFLAQVHLPHVYFQPRCWCFHSKFSPGPIPKAFTSISAPPEGSTGYRTTPNFPRWFLTPNSPLCPVKLYPPENVWYCFTIVWLFWLWNHVISAHPVVLGDIFTLATPQR